MSRIHALLIFLLAVDDLPTVVALCTGSTSSAAETTALRVLGESLCASVMTERMPASARDRHGCAAAMARDGDRLHGDRRLSFRRWVKAAVLPGATAAVGDRRICGDRCRARSGGKLPGYVLKSAVDRDRVEAFRAAMRGELPLPGRHPRRHA
jgi:hypothetical protein